jgi:hypothetical protein
MVHTYDEDIEKLQENLESVQDENIFDVPVSTYVTYNTQEQGNFVLDTNSIAIKWEKKTRGMCENYEYGMEWEKHETIDTKFLTDTYREHVLYGIITSHGKNIIESVSSNYLKSIVSGNIVKIKKHFEEFEFIVKSLGIPLQKKTRGVYKLNARFNAEGHKVLKHDILRPRIKTSAIGTGDCFSFVLEQQSRYLLGDFTIVN